MFFKTITMNNKNHWRSPSMVDMKISSL